MLVFGSFFGHLSGLAGFVATCIAIGGFLGHARPALRRQDDVQVRRGTVIGGLIGLGAAALLAALGSM